MTLPVFGTTSQQDQRLCAQGLLPPNPSADVHSDTICQELKEVDSVFGSVGCSLAVPDCRMVFCINGDRAMFFHIDARRHGVDHID